MFKAKLILLFILCVTSPAFGKDLYVNNSGSPVCSDSTTYANNTAAAPWCTLLRAARGNTDGNRSTSAVSGEAAAAGDIVYVTAGTYNYSGSWDGDDWLSVLYQPVNSGTSGAWITFYALGTVNLTGNYVGVGDSGLSGTIGSSSSQYIKWFGPFTFTEATGAWRNAMVNISASNQWVEGVVVTGRANPLGDNHAGMIVHGARDGDCTGGINNITIKNNEVSGFTGDTNSTGITLYCIGDNVTVEHNYLHDNGHGIYGKEAYTASTSVNIRYNKLYSNDNDGIRIQSFDGFRIYQNIMQDNGLAGYTFHCNSSDPAGDGTSPSNMYIVNNTMDGNQAGIYLKGSCSHLRTNYVRNNIMTNNTYGIRSDGGECIGTTYLTQSDINFNYNVFQHSGDFFEGGVSFATWQSSYGQDANSSTSADPLYTDESGNVFTLQALSPCRENGANDGIDILDLDGDSSTVDRITIGAYITGNETIGIETSGSSTTQTISGGVTLSPGASKK